MIAALYVARGGAYFGLPDVDPWDADRDARKYSGPWPVVAHPPCARWCQLAPLVEARYGYRIGEDGGCFASALHAVRLCGGVLEHPAYTRAWAAFGLRRPKPGSWQAAPCGGWVTQVSQCAYGHRARKRTWLYYVGSTRPPALRWDEPATAVTMSWLRNHGSALVERMGKRERNATPRVFRDLLVRLARDAWACRVCGVVCPE